MISSLSAASVTIAWTLGAVHLLCLFGFGLFRHRTVFAMRVPEVVLMCMVWKFVAFLLGAWLLLDPECPCGMATLLFWLDSTANYANVLRKVVLLFRYEIRAALDKNSVAASVYVRYRHLLRSRWQLAIMVAMLLLVGIGFIVVVVVDLDAAAKPCLTDRIQDNSMFFWSVIVAWLVFMPLMVMSVWTTHKLKSHPKDNWKIGVESTVSSIYSTVIATIAVIILCAAPGYDNIIFMLFVTSVLLPLLNFLLPVHLHRQSLQHLAHMELQQLTSLSRLLKDQNFLVAFDKFLRSEFASENLFFWREVEKMEYQYRFLLPADHVHEKDSHPSQHRPSTPADGDSSQFLACADDCVNLARQCIGEQAPWQINVSGDTAQSMEKAILRVSDVLGTERERELKSLLEDTLRSLLVAKKEVYEALRKDSYPRFLVSEECATLNRNENFKRLLAAEKWDDEVLQTTTPPSPRQSVGDDHKKSLSFEVTLTAPGGILWGKQSRLALEPPSRERNSNSRISSENSEGRSDAEARMDVHVAGPSDAGLVAGVAGPSDAGLVVAPSDAGVVVTPSVAVQSVDAQPADVQPVEVRLDVQSVESTETGR